MNALMTNDGWFNETTLHPLGLAFLMTAIVAQLFVPRRFALVPLLAIICVTGPAQRIALASIDLNFLRLMVLAGWIRILARNELRPLRWNALDIAFIAWAACSAFMGTLQKGTFGSMIYWSGFAYDAFGIYFLARMLVRDWRDVRSFGQAAALASIPMMLAFSYERITGSNPFAIFGGVPAETTVRMGVPRCQGPFTHPILAGVFWTALMPLMGAIWVRGGANRALALAGVGSAIAIVFMCGSATPLLSAAAGVMAAALILVRRWIRIVQILALGGLAALQLAMISPVWHLMARGNIVDGATGWYRYRLMQDFFVHFGDWWLMGTQDRSTWWNNGRWAITNEYVMQGLEGGLLGLLLFITVIIVAFMAVGRTWRHADRPQVLLRPGNDGAGVAQVVERGGRRERVVLAWALGVLLAVHVVSFLSVTNFGQAIFVWYVPLGMIASLTPTRGRRIAFRAAPPRPDAAKRDPNADSGGLRLAPV
jgi:hypothetical protein